MQVQFVALEGHHHHDSTPACASQGSREVDPDIRRVP
jgi:hypothetical protein